MSKDEINRIETLADKCDAFAASVFENTGDIIAASFAFKAYIERRKELRRKQELEMKS